MSRTPDKPDITAIKISRLEKSEKTFSQNRTLQTDRKTDDKLQTKKRSPLMLLFLLNKKFRSRVEHSFMKINLCKNTWSYRKIIAKYISSILKCKIKSHETNVLQKLRGYSKRAINFKNVCISLGSWFKMKTRNQKLLGFISIASKWNRNDFSNKQEKKQQPKYELPSRLPTMPTRKNENRSLDAGKSVSASKLNLSKKIDSDNQDSSAQIAKIKKQSQQLKLMQLSEEVREALKKVQRFDRFIYAQEAQKVCKQPLTLELKRLQKIKNSQKEMRTQFYDNQLTITALFNHIKLVAEMNRDINELAKLKEKYDAEQSKRKQEQFKLALQKKRNKGKNTQALVKQLVEGVEGNLLKKDYDKAKQQIALLLSKHQKQQAIKDRLLFYQALLDLITRQKEAENILEETYKFTSILGSIDFNQNQNTIKSLKQMQKQITILHNRAMKNEMQNQKALNIYRSFEAIGTKILQSTQQSHLVEKDQANSQKSKQNEKNLNETNKKIAQLQKELQESKITIVKLEEVRKEYDNIMAQKSQFENKLTSIFAKIQNKTDFKGGIEELIKDKKFADKKPYSLFLNLDSVYKQIAEEQVTYEITFLINFITSLTQIQAISKEQSVHTLAENFIKQHPKLVGLSKNVEDLVKKVVDIKKVEQENTFKKLQNQSSNDQMKSKSLNKKIQNLEKINREQALKISSIEKEKKELESGKKPPTQSKSQQIFKNQAALTQNLKAELKQYKDKILVLEKQISSLKNSQKNQISQKKETKADESRKLQEQLKKLQQQAKIKREKEAQQKTQRNREIAVQSQLSKSIVSLTTILETKNCKQLQIESNKFLKVFEKDQRLSHIATLVSNLIKLLVEKQSTQLAKKKQLDSLVDSQSRDKEKLEALSKLTKQSEAEIKSGAYLSTPDYWDRFLVGVDTRSAGVLKDLTKILKQLTSQIKNKNQKLQQLSSKAKAQSSSVSNILQLLKNIQTEITKKDYFKSDEGIMVLENNSQTQDKIIKAFFRVIKKFSETSRSKLSDERKLSQKSIKSYESQLEKMNNFISQYEMKLKQKQHQYQQLYKSFVQLQKSNIPEDQKKPSSLRGSRRSIKSNSSDKDNELKSIKASMQVFAEDEKNMLERLEMAEHEKVALVERINYLQEELRANLKNNEDLRSTIKGLQRNITEEHSNYQRQYEAWRQKTISQSEEIESIRRHYQKQFERREGLIVEQFENISRERQQALQKYHKDLSNVQGELNNEITHLREQLRLKNIENLKLEQLEILQKNNQSLQADYQSLRNKLGEAEQNNNKYHQLVRQHGQLQSQLASANSKHKQYEQQNNSLKAQLQLAKSSQQSRVSSTDNTNPQYQNSLKENTQLQLQVNNLGVRNKDLQDKNKNLQSNLQRITEELRGKNSLKEQADAQLQNTVKQNGQLQLQINSLTVKVRALEQSAQKFSQLENALQQKIASLQNQLRNKPTGTGAIPVQQSAKILSLEQELIRLRSEQDQIINNEVVAALKNQEQDFNRFLVGHEKQIEAHFFNVVIPERIKQAQAQFIPTVLNQSHSNPQVSQLQRELKILQEQLKNNEKILRETEFKYQDQIRIIDHLNGDIQKLKNTNIELDKKIQSSSQIEERIKRYLTSLQISWQEAITGSISQKTTALYLRPTTKIETKQVIRQIVKLDPRQQATINQLRAKVQDQIRALREAEQKLIQTENSLKEQVRRVHSSWEAKYNEQTLHNEKRIHELIQQRNFEPARTKSIEQFRVIQSKLEQLNRRYIEQTKIKTQLENKYSLSVSSYEAKIQKLGNQKIIEVGHLNNELNIIREKCQDLTARLAQKQQQLKALDENRLRELQGLEISIGKKYEEKITFYERRIAEYNNQISNVKTSYQSSLNSFNHQDCERKYRQMQQRLNKEVVELRTKLSQTTKSGREEIQLLKEVINNQKLEFKNFETMINTFRQAKEEAQRQKDSYFNELKAISSEKDRQIFKLRAEYENRLTAMSIEKTTLQSKMAQNLQSIQTNRAADHNSHLKILELQSQINNKNQQIKHVNDLSERRRRQLEQLHQKLMFAEREIENLRVTAENMQNHIMKLETDLSYFNNEVHKYKMALIETQSRQSVLRNDLMRVKTDSDNDNNVHLKEEINALKDEIIRITSSNIHQLHNISTAENYDIARIRKMIHEIESQRSSERYGYNQDQMQTLKRISEEVTELVAANRQLQTKCIILESQIDGNSKFRENIDIFTILQDRMENLVNFLLEKSIIDNSQNYSKFMYSSKEILGVQDIEGYFNNWLNFMKSLFLLANDLKSQQLRLKAEEMIQLKEQMNQILDKHIQFVEDESYETLDKYKMIFSDIKILLREFLNTRNQEYIQMIWRSLEPHEANEPHV